MRQGSGIGNPESVGGGEGDRDTAESEDGAGSNGSWYAETETGDAQVGE